MDIIRPKRLNRNSMRHSREFWKGIRFNKDSTIYEIP